MNTDNRDYLQQLIGDDYRLQWIIGHGGMSTVWLADDTNNDREVAIKVLRPEFSANEEFLARFRNEALSAEGINSPNVVATYDYREVTTDVGYAMCFIAMEYIRGESLADVIAREGKLDEALALDVLEQAAHGLSVIHRMGLIHRDIKPGNLMITQNGKVKITDFGIAKAAAAVPLTRTGMVVGTAQYVSPEQAQGMHVTAASDVYSLGVVGYEMLSGARPFTGDSSVSVALAHVSHEPPALSTQVSAPARELIGIALRKDPRLRFHDGNEMQLAIAQVRQGLRPAQPQGAPTGRVAVEPSATASTQMLASVSQPTTVRPAQPAQPEYPVHTAAKKGGGVGLGVLLGIAGLAVLGGLAWAFFAGPLSGSGTTSTTAPTTTRPTLTQTRTVEPRTGESGEPTVPAQRNPVSSRHTAPTTLSVVDTEPTEPTGAEHPTHPKHSEHPNSPGKPTQSQPGKATKHSPAPQIEPQPEDPAPVDTGTPPELGEPTGDTGTPDSQMNPGGDVTAGGNQTNPGNGLNP